MNKSSATNNTTPAVKQEYAAPATTLVTARLFVMTISCAWNRIHITWGRISGRLKTKPSSLLCSSSWGPSRLGPRMMGYGLSVLIISAQARATAESGEAAPGIVAHPPFSTNEPRSQA